MGSGAEDAVVVVGSSGRYSVGEAIGQGGAGAVYRAHDTQLNRWVAIKRLHPEGEEAKARAGKIIHEARHLAAVQHPNIVTVYDFIEDQDDVLVVMELVRGRTLQEIVDKAPLTVPDFVEIFRQTLEGLIAAHSLGMLHRDIKPSNVMVTDLPSGAFQVKVVDFGLAKISLEPSQQTIDQGGGLLGSVFTMAPEQFEGRRLDMRTDLYSLGCVAYFALTTYFPFTGDTVPEVICAHLQQRVTPLEQLRPDVPLTLCGWISRLMHVHPDERPDSSSQALLELQAALDPSGHLQFGDTVITEEEEAAMMEKPIVVNVPPLGLGEPNPDAPKQGTGPVKAPISLARPGTAAVRPLTTRVVKPGTGTVQGTAVTPEPEAPAPVAAAASPRNYTGIVPVLTPDDAAFQRRRRIQLTVCSIAIVGICFLLWPKPAVVQTPIAVSDHAAMVSAVNKTAVIQGKIASVKKSADGSYLFTFEGSDARLVAPAALSETDANALVGTSVRVKGDLKSVDGAPQIQVGTTSQIEKI